MIDTQCPQCNKQFSLSEQLAGEMVRCKDCSSVFRVPFGNAADVEVVDMPSSGPMYKPRGRVSDEIDYEIFGTEMQYVEIVLDPGETVIAEAGMMMYMDNAIKMETMFGSPGQQGGGFWQKVTSAGKRMLTGESMFITTFSNTGAARAKVAFAAPYPGKIIPLHLDQLGGEIVCQKDAFLCGAKGIEIEVAFNKNIGVGLFGGEGFIMQRLTGDGIACCHAGGTILERELAPGEVLKIDTGCIVALAPSVRYDIQFVGGFKNTLFGGEGLFLATLAGPGNIWLQSLPFSRLAGRVAAVTGFNRGTKGEGSVLDVGGIGKMILGDR